MASGFASSYLEPSSGEVVIYRARRLAPGAAVSFLAGNISGLLGVGGGVIERAHHERPHARAHPRGHDDQHLHAGRDRGRQRVCLRGLRAARSAAGGTRGLGVIIGAQAGAHLSMRVSQDTLRLAFVIVAAVFAAGMFSRFLEL